MVKTDEAAVAAAAVAAVDEDEAMKMEMRLDRFVIMELANSTSTNQPGRP
jgi:hypothetical protein